MTTATPSPSPSVLIAVLGATGRLGGHVVAQALDRGHRVCALVHRTPPHTSHPRLEIRDADVRRPETIRNALVGTNLVISCLGSASADPPTVQALGARVLSEAMTALGLQRLVSVTGSGARLPNEPLTPHRHAKRVQMLAAAPHLLADGDRHLASIAASDLAWTAVRVPLMTHGRTAGSYVLQPHAPPSNDDPRLPPRRPRDARPCHQSRRRSLATQPPSSPRRAATPQSPSR